MKTDDGAALRPLDLDAPRLVAELDARSRRRSLTALAVALGIAVLGQVPVLGLVSTPFLMILGIAWPRAAVASLYRPHLSVRRNLVSSWVSRFALITIAGLHITASVPVLGFLLSPTLVWGACMGQWLYLRHHLHGEIRRAPISPIENLLLIFFGALAAAVVVALILLALGAGALVKMFGAG